MSESVLLAAMQFREDNGEGAPPPPPHTPPPPRNSMQLRLLRNRVVRY